MPTEDQLNISVDDLELSVRCRRGLQRMNITSVRDLLEITEEELCTVKNFGETSLHEVRQVLADCGGLMIGQSPAKPASESFLTLRQMSQLTQLSLKMITGNQGVENIKNALLKRGLMLADGEPVDFDKTAALDPTTTFWQVAHAMSPRLRNKLLETTQSPEMTLKEMSHWTSRELLSIKGVGETGVAELEELLRKADMKLAVSKSVEPPPEMGVEPPPEIGVGASTLIQDLFEHGMISVRAKNVLRQMGVTTLGQATQLSKNAICSYKNAGEVTCAEIDDLLKRGGMRYCDSREERKLKRSISVLNLSARACNSLEAGNIETLGDLISKTEKDLQRFRSFGQTCLWEVKKKLAEQGLSLQTLDSDSETKSNILYDTRFKTYEVLTRKVETTIGPVGEPKLGVEIEVQGGTLIITPHEQQPIILDYKNGQVMLKVADCLSVNIGEAHKLGEPSFRSYKWKR